MKRWLALLSALVAVSTDGAPGFGRGGGLTCPKGYIGGGLTPCTRPYAFFEFAPATGAGMGTACACAEVTGAKGEAMTFTRASAGTCLDGNTAAGIVPGDMVSCGSSLPRVMPGGDGSGPLGLLVERAATNLDPRSEEINDSAYANFVGTGGTAPVLNGANAALSPLNTLTAEDYTFAATSGTQSSGRAIAILSAAAHSAQYWLMGYSSSGTADLCIQTGASTAACSACPFVAGSYIQCKVENVASIASGNIYLGNLTSLNGGTARASNRVYVWGVDAETGPVSTSYIPTAGATATRAADVAYVTLASPPCATGVCSSAATVSTPMPASSVWIGYLLSTSGAAPYMAIYNLGASMRAEQVNATPVYAVGSAAGNLIAARIALWNTGALLSGSRDGTAFTPAVGIRTAPAAMRVYLGASYAAGNELDGVIRQVCFDPDPMRCR